MAAKQIKFTVDHTLAELFKAACANANVSMASQFSAFMSGFCDASSLKSLKPLPVPFDTRGKRRTATLGIIKQLESILTSEEAYLDNIPVNLRSGLFFDNSSQSVDAISEALDFLRQAF